MPFASKVFKANFPSKCDCGESWGKGADVGYHKVEGKHDWVCSNADCPKYESNTVHVKSMEEAVPGKTNIVDAEPFQNEIDAITKYAEVCKSIGYPVELWNLSTIWNCERMQRK